MNVQLLVGNIGQTPELRNTNSGDAVVNVSLATDDGWYSKQEGRWIERVTWHRLSLFSRAAEGFANGVGKGQRIAVTGTTLKDKYTDQEGVERESVTVRVDKWEFAGPKIDGARNASEANDLPQSEPERGEDRVPF